MKLHKSLWLHPLAIIFYCVTASAAYFIPDLGVTTAKLAANAVTTAKLGIAGGSTSTVGYPFSSDPNTGFYSRTADEVSIVQGGNERVRVGATISSTPDGSTTLMGARFARAAVIINATVDADLSGTYSRTLTTVTVTATAHGYIVGNRTYLNFTSGTAVDNLFTVVSVPDANTFTVTHGTSGSTSGNVTIERKQMESGSNFNISNVTDSVGDAAGDTYINFSTAMPDTLYTVSCTTWSGANNGLCGIEPSSKTTTSVHFITENNSQTDSDYDGTTVTFFR